MEHPHHPHHGPLQPLELGRGHGRVDGERVPSDGGAVDLDRQPVTPAHQGVVAGLVHGRPLLGDHGHRDDRVVHEGGEGGGDGGVQEEGGHGAHGEAGRPLPHLCPGQPRAVGVGEVHARLGEDRLFEAVGAPELDADVGRLGGLRDQAGAALAVAGRLAHQFPVGRDHPHIGEQPDPLAGGDEVVRSAHGRGEGPLLFVEAIQLVLGQGGQFGEELLPATLEGLAHVVERLLHAAADVVGQVGHLLPPAVHLAQGEHDPFPELPRGLGPLPERLHALLGGGHDLLVRVTPVEVEDALGADELVAREAEHLGLQLVFNAPRVRR